LKKRKKDYDEISEKFFAEENKKLIILPIRLIAILTSIAGLIALLFEIRYYTEFSIEIYFGRLIATAIAFIVLASTYTKFGKKYPFLFLHTLLLSLIASFGSIILLIPDTILINSLILALLIFTSALFLGWDVRHQIILSIYYNVVFAASIILNDRSIYFLPSLWGSVLFVLLISFMSVIASSINYRLRKDAMLKSYLAKLSEQKFRNIFENSVQGIFQASKSGSLLTINPSFVKILGYSEESEVKSLKFPEDFFKYSEDYENLMKLLERHGKIKNFKVTFIANNKHYVNIKMNAQIIKDENGNFQYYEGSIQDITRQVQAEVERNRAIKQLQIAKIKAERNSVKAVKASKTKSQFLAKINHELRTPMNSVIGYLTLIEGELFNDEMELTEFARNAKISADSIVDIINNNLDLYKIEAGKMSLDDVEFDLRNEVSKSISLIAPLVEDGLKITESIDSAVPEKVIGDAVRYRQVLVNLLGNAAKFTSKGEISVKVDVRSFDHSTVTISTEVKDTGIGIAADRLSTIFDNNKKIKANDSEMEGAGLGLLICKELVSMMEGEITAESELGEGSIFCFTAEMKYSKSGEETTNVSEVQNDLPQNDSTENISPEKSHDRKETSIPPQKFPKNGNASKRLLLVEDNKGNQKVELKILREIGYNVEAVSDGEAAIEAVKSHAFDLVLMDVEMKDMDGITATKRIRELEGDISNIPVIAVTAHSSMKDRELCLSARMNDYIAKPINIQFLKMIIDEWLNHKKD
jgi:PAS domain S-box-containing protein